MTSDAVVLLIAVFGLLLLALACQRLFRARFVAAAGSGMMGALLLAGAALFFVVSLNLHTYNRLTYEQPVAEIVFEARGPQRYRATLAQVPSGELQMFMLAGDEWQLDARVLKWHAPATMLGLDAAFRLDRIGGRYRDVASERSEPRTVYELARPPGVDVWALVRRFHAWLPWVDALYGSATYLPMADGAHFAVSVAPTGLVGRPLNRAAREAVSTWH